MSSIIQSFESVDSASLAGVGGDSTLKNTDAYKKPIPGDTGIVNVIKDFSWFSGGSKDALSDLSRIPFVSLVEREQVLNSTLSQAIYYMNAAENVVQEGVSAVSKFSESIGLSEPTGGEKKQSVVFKDLIDKFKGLQEGDRALMSSNKLESLAGIYLTEKTGFRYVMPYFANPPQVSNSWGDGSSGGSGLRGAIDTGFEVVDQITDTVNIAQPGVYIQKPKFFQHSPDGPEITIQFPLFNTIKRKANTTPYQQNYELLWLLTYQNKTFKTSFGRSIPPKIYSVTIPGIINMPYAYISSLNVDFLGTVRNKNVSIPGQTINAPVPDAYNVTITVKSLLTDYANLMIGSNFSVSEKGNTVTKTIS